MTEEVLQGHRSEAHVHLDEDVVVVVDVLCEGLDDLTRGSISIHDHLHVRIPHTQTALPSTGQ